MKMKILTLVFILIFLITSCNNTENIDNNQEKSVEYIGIYQGLYNDNAKIDVINIPYEYNSFKLSEDVKNSIKDYSKNSLISFKIDSKNIITELNNIDKVAVKAVFNGMADDRFAEFNMQNKIYVFEISSEVREKVNNLKEGVEVNITLKQLEIPENNLRVINIDKN
ncbi:hypothetical protein [Tepidibacter formicigenes]|jgi:hypothetical protein|uniref:Lipoprotein n=1 Tax=Tepidibacter formicigenes DSM 15518 TaxID=1123349 RepID=A0A1M6Q8V7_9FIRM|nr:hypothetical protein [Tepidibacter formicigenes]SHK16523.1 hypothetical protein SAMN02744037_01772 [Tepidibacter formicigenes DSM 15518]